VAEEDGLTAVSAKACCNHLNNYYDLGSFPLSTKQMPHKWNHIHCTNYNYKTYQHILYNMDEIAKI